MGESLPAQILKVPGAPSSVRIGTITSASPLIVALQGKDLDPRAVGLAVPITPLVGASVVLLGQSKTQGADPSSWLILGMQASTVTAPATVQDFDNTLQSTTSVAYVVGAPTVGVAFYPPPSGSVLIHHFASIDNSAAGSGFISPEIRLGATVGTGAIVVAANDQNALRNANLEFVKAGLTMLYSNLTPGVQHNVSLWHRSSVGTNTAFFNDRNVIVQPV